MKHDKTNITFWQRFAFLYVPFVRKNHRQYAEVYHVCSNYITPDMRVLAIAFGTGQFFLPLATDVKELVATDFSERMVEWVRKKVNAANITFSVQDDAQLSYEQQLLDAVFIANALHIMPYPNKALSQIYRVLKSGGILFAPTLVYDFGKSKHVGMKNKIDFKTFHKRESREFAEYISKLKSIVNERKMLPGKTVPECVLIAPKEATQSDR